MKILEKINRFYLIIAVVGFVIGVLRVMTVRGITGAFNDGSDTSDEELVEYGIEEENLNDAYGIIIERNIEPLDLGN
jgi:hypothetical protein